MNTHDSTCRDLALQTGYAVVFPEYTLAPQARYPTQQEECYAVVKWVHKYGQSKLLSQNVFSIVGDSAGGLRNLVNWLLLNLIFDTRPIDGRRQHFMLDTRAGHSNMLPSDG